MLLTGGHIWFTGKLVARVLHHRQRRGAATDEFRHGEFPAPALGST